MSQKKRKKSRPQGARGTGTPAETPSAGGGKRFKPLAYGLLWGDLVFLAACQLMVRAGVLNETNATIATVLGVILLLAALVMQFGPSDRTPKPPRL